MRRWIIAVLFSMLMSYPAVSGAADNTLDSGRSSLFNYPLMNIPIGEGSSSGTNKDKKKDGEVSDQEKEKKILDKKVDDAINKAWEEK
jgi:hypothetical protein